MLTITNTHERLREIKNHQIDKIAGALPLSPENCSPYPMYTKYTYSKFSQCATPTTTTTYIKYTKVKQEQNALKLDAAKHIFLIERLK